MSITVPGLDGGVHVPGLVVVGFDPGITSPGIAAVERASAGAFRILGHAVIRTKPKDHMRDRLGRIGESLSCFIRDHRPSCLIIERQSGAQVGAHARGEFNADNSKTILTVGVAYEVARAYRVPAVEVDPKKAKIGVLGRGSGNADKKQVQKMIAALFGIQLPQDASDAAALAISGLMMKPWERAA